MDNPVSAGKIQIPAKFDIFMTVIGLIGISVALYLFWSEYLPMTQIKTPYGIFIGAVLVVSAGFFIFGARSWYNRHKSDLRFEEKRRSLELGRKRLENKQLKAKLKK